MYYDTTSRKRFISGTVHVGKSIDYSFYDRIGSLVTGSFTGALNLKSQVSLAPDHLKSTLSKLSNTEKFSSLDNKRAKAFGYIHEDDFRYIGSK